MSTVVSSQAGATRDNLEDASLQPKGGGMNGFSLMVRISWRRKSFGASSGRWKVSIAPTCIGVLRDSMRRNAASIGLRYFIAVPSQVGCSLRCLISSGVYSPLGRRAEAFTNQFG